MTRRGRLPDPSKSEKPTGTLVSPRRARRNRWRAATVVIGWIGTTLVYGDGTITPAISVLSAIEGLKMNWRRSSIAPSSR